MRKGDHPFKPGIPHPDGEKAWYPRPDGVWLESGPGKPPAFYIFDSTHPDLYRRRTKEEQKSTKQGSASSPARSQRSSVSVELTADEREIADWLKSVIRERTGSSNAEISQFIHSLSRVAPIVDKEWKEYVRMRLADVTVPPDGFGLD